MLRRFLLALLGVLALAAQAQAAEIILYSSPDYQGKSLRVTGDVPNLRDYRFNDEVSSVVVVSGEWVLYEDRDYGGKAVRVPPGSYPSMGAVLMDNNELSSLRVLTPAAPPPPPPVKLPDLKTNIDARSGYIGDPAVPDGVSFRGVTAFVTITNAGEGRAAPSTLAIEAGPSELNPYRAAGIQPCATREAPWPPASGEAAACTRLRNDDIQATPSGGAMTCAVPALEPGATARCVASFSVLYNWLVPPVPGWDITATADAAKKVRESNEKNNGQGSPVKIGPDKLPAL